MCVPPDAQPPVIAEAGSRPRGNRTQLFSTDGTAFAAFEARAKDPDGTGIVVLPDIRGLFAFYESLAEGLAAVGLDAIAIDYFGRTAGTSERPAGWDCAPHIEATRPDLVGQDVAAAVEWLRTNRRAARVFTLGFCFGGSHSMAQAAAGLGLSGVIGFYGPPRKWRENRASPIDLVDQFECPVMGLFGGADDAIPPQHIQEFEDALTAAGIEHQLHTYPGAPHSFFDRNYGEYAAECADAWRRILEFTGRA